VENPIKQVRIIEIIKETENATTFVLEPLHGWKPEYEAGQFLTVLFHTPFGEKRRSYSFSSSPDLKEPLSITVKKVDNGEFSRRLLYETKVGEVLDTAGVSGLFILPEESQHIDQVFFLAAGSGITPCYSMIKTLLHTTSKQVVLIYSNKNERDTIFLRSLTILLQQFSSRFQIRFLNSNSEGIFNRRLSNWLLKILLKQYLKTEKPRTLFYLCGPFEYMQMIRITLLTEDITSDQIRKEIFTPLPQLNPPRPPDTEKHAVTIHSSGHHYILPVQYPKTILAAAKEKNILLPYSCESGICGTCTATCVKGEVWMKYNAVLTEKELSKGRVLTCQGFPVGGDVTLVF
jgi:ring-1,2-phenylacetyl-CoA epoxidase subunit PaaE